MPEKAKVEIELDCSTLAKLEKIASVEGKKIEDVFENITDDFFLSMRCNQPQKV